MDPRIETVKTAKIRCAIERLITMTPAEVYFDTTLQRQEKQERQDVFTP